jgi:hypothetical protein
MPVKSFFNGLLDLRKLKVGKGIGETGLAGEDGA